MGRSLNIKSISGKMAKDKTGKFDWMKKFRLLI